MTGAHISMLVRKVRTRGRVSDTVNRLLMGVNRLLQEETDAGE